MSSPINAPRLSASAFLTLLALALPHYGHAVVAPVLPAYSVTPNPAPADKPFTLYLNGASSGCYTTFSRESVIVVGKRIDLSFVATSTDIYPRTALDGGDGGPTPDIACPVYDLPQAAADTVSPIMPPLYDRPTYSMPALKTGTYEVYATRMYECLYTEPMCKIGVQTVSAGTLTVQPEGTLTYTINPTTTAAGTDFEISLLSYQFSCATRFDNLSATVNGTVITLAFRDQEQTGIACPMIYKPYGPSYKLKGLKAGVYTVNAYRLPACTPCGAPGVTTKAGTLTVQDQITRDGWFLKKKETLAEKPFTMQLLNNKYGNCGTSFSHTSVVAQTGGIYTSFLVETDPTRVCIADLRPWGPSFEMKGLKVGVYPVYVTTLLQCEVVAPFCAVDRLLPTPSDTLMVMQTVSTLLSDLRASAPKVELTGSRAAFTLPQGIGGTWKTELLTMSGQRLSANVFTAEGGSRAEIDLGAGLQRGIYILRLAAPDGETHLLPIVRTR